MKSIKNQRQAAGKSGCDKSPTETLAGPLLAFLIFGVAMALLAIAVMCGWVK